MAAKTEAKKTPPKKASRFSVPQSVTKAKGELAGQIILIYGAPKIGKTTVANDFPGSVFLPFEPGQDHVDHFQIPTTGIITTWKEMSQACAVLIGGQHDFQVPIIDTVDLCYQTCAEYIAKQRGVEHIGDLGHGKGYALTAQEFTRVLKKLAAEAGGLILLSHSKTREVKVGEVEMERTGPSLGASAQTTLAGMVDMILYMEVRKVKDDSGKDQTVRVLRTRPSKTFMAGCRPQRPLPSAIYIDKRHPYESILNAWENGVSDVPEAIVEKPDPAKAPTTSGKTPKPKGKATKPANDAGGAEPASDKEPKLDF